MVDGGLLTSFEASSAMATVGSTSQAAHPLARGPNRKLFGVESYDGTVVRNWSQATTFKPEVVFFPATRDEVAAVVRGAGELHRRITLMGKGHSWNPLMAGSDYLLCTARLNQILAIDEAKGLVTIEPGATIAEVEDTLLAYGLCIPGNIVGTRNITFGGLMATGSHGSGRTAPPMSDLLTEVEMVLPSGEVCTFSDEASGKELMDALRLNLGLFGVMTRMTFKVEPSFRVEATDYRVKLSEVFERLPQFLRDYNSVEVLWFPFMDSVTVKTWRRTEKKKSWWPGLRGLLSWVQRHLGYLIFEHHIAKKLVDDPTSTPKLMQRFGPLVFRPGTSILDVGEAVHYVNEAERFPINETEIAIGFDDPARLERVKAAWDAVINQAFADAEHGTYALNIIAHLRFSGGSSAYMSPAYGNERTAWLDFGSYHESAGWDELVGRIWRSWRTIPGVKLHWAKEMQRHEGLDLEAMYGKTNIEKFLEHRARFDPKGTFAHDLARRLFRLKLP